jgi:hypothetical protein
MRTLILSSGLLAAALVGGPQTAFAQNEPAFCLQSSRGSMNCIYESMEQCRQAGGSATGICHGENGKGDGPVSAELRTKPSDLTLPKRMIAYFRPKSCIGLSMDEGRSGLTVVMRCQFGDPCFHAPNHRMLRETAFWRLSII